MFLYRRIQHEYHVAMSPAPQIPLPVDQLLAQLRNQLRALRRQNGEPSTREVERRSQRAISHTTVNSVFRCEKIPSWSQLELVVRALSGDPDEFRKLWIELRNAVDPLELAETSVAVAQDVQQVQEMQQFQQFQQAQEGGSQDRSTAGRDLVVYGVDLCLCLETGFGTENEVKDMFYLASRLLNAVVSRMVAYGHGIGNVRIRYILFGTEINNRDNDYDSGFRPLLDISKIDFERYAPRRSEFNPKVADALKEAFTSDWSKDYPQVRHIVAVWAASLLSPSSAYELSKIWENNSSNLSSNGKRLIIFAPDGGGWTTIDDSFESSLRYPSRAGAGLPDKHFHTIIDAIIADI
jgi:hypothetical protein